MIIDASVWIASVLAEDAHHAAGLSFMRRFVTERLAATLPLLVWPEIAGAVARRTGDADRGMQVAGNIAAQRWIQSMPVDAPLANESMRLAAALRLRGADAVYVALASMRRMPLITLDTEMIARAGDVVDVLTPEQWLQKR